MYELVKFIPFLPLLGFLILGLFGSKIKNEKLIGTIATSTVGISFIIAVSIFMSMLNHTPEKPVVVDLFTWIEAGNFKINLAYQVDQLSILFTMIITGIGSLIHIFSIGYMHGDKSFFRFFAYLNLFIFMMLNLVLGANFLVTFLGWEGVGLASYLLIGFWYDKKFPGYRITWTGDAANKAFIMNRIGDLGLLLAMFLIYLNFGTLDYQLIKETLVASSGTLAGGGLITAIALLIFLGCTGKSAQIPLSGWLPDAMAGPTPVSSLIHAATMVTAGIFLISRNSVIFALSPTALSVVAAIGAATALLAATIGLVQNDIKKVLAYSTVSQLGFMFTALGVGAFGAGVFHVMTHAFFKGLLFLGAGSVIHGMHHEQNIKKMGGLKKYMPITYFTFLIGTLAISGIPPFSGFFSKDEILWKAYSDGNIILWGTLALAALFTAFYMFRMFYLTFLGKERFDHHHVHPHESPATMTFPLIVLAIASALGGFLGVPHALGMGVVPNIFEHWLDPVFEDAIKIIGRGEGGAVHASEYILMIFSTVVAIGSILLAKKFYSNSNWTTPKRLVKNFSFSYKILDHKWYLDNVYYIGFVNPIFDASQKLLWKFFDVKIIDGIVNGSAQLTNNIGEQTRKIQSGVVQNYALLMLVGIVFIIAFMVFK
jgi:NADH-quinone oxidoreductase subunit L